MQMEKAPTLRRKALHVGTVAGVAAAAVLATAGPSAAADAAVVSPTFGPTGGGNSVTITWANPTTPFIQGGVYVVFEAAATCTASNPPIVANTDVAAANVRVITPGKLAVTVPTGVVSANNAGVHSVCVYDTVGTSVTTDDTLIESDNAAYTVGPIPTIATVTPAASPSSGGGDLRITGTNLDDVTVTIGGASVTRTNGGAGDEATVFEGTIPPRAAGGPFPVVVTYADGGSATEAAAFTYSNGVVVEPNTSPNTKARTDLAVTGVGFSALNFTSTNGQTPNDPNAHVYLVKGEYNPAKSGQLKTNGQTTECLNVLRISDEELVCSLYLAGGGIPMSAERSVSATVSGTTLTSATGNFGPGDVGMGVTGSNSIPVGTTIISVTDPTKVVLSRAATSAISTATNLNLTHDREFTTATFGTGGDLELVTSSTTATGAHFTSADIGRVISGTGIPPGTTILEVPTATTARLSADTTQAAGGTYTIAYTAPLTPVPNGTYTVTVVSNGSLDANTGANADPSFSKSIISSGSTFTVADY